MYAGRRGYAPLAQLCAALPHARALSLAGGIGFSLMGAMRDEAVSDSLIIISHFVNGYGNDSWVLWGTRTVSGQRCRVVLSDLCKVSVAAKSVCRTAPPPPQHGSGWAS
jgi:hypothetical protein